MYKSELIINNKIEFPECIYMEDIPFTTISNLLANKIKILNRIVYYYVRRHDSIMGQSNSRTCIDLYKAVDTTLKMIKKYNLCDYKFIFDYIVLDNHFLYRDRIKEIYERTGIDQYSLTDSEFDYASTVISNLLHQTSIETLSCLSADKRCLYTNLLKNSDSDVWSYYIQIDCDKPLISVIVPFYNVEKYIEQCLESLEKQTLRNIEVIIIDDGSPDNSLAIAEEFVIKNKNFSLYKKENGGLGSARNYGMQYAKGQYILFLDSDDTLPPRACELLYNKAHKTDSDVVFGRTAWKKDGVLRNVEYLEKWYEYDDNKNYRDELYYAIGMPIATAKLIRSEVIKNNNIEFMHIIGEDMPYSLQVFYYSKIISVVKNVVYYRTERADEGNKSITQTFNSNTIRDRVIGMEFIRKFCDDMDLTGIKGQILWQIVNMNNIYISISNKTEKEKAFEYIKKYIRSFQDSYDLSVMSKNLGFNIEDIDSVSYQEYEELAKNAIAEKNQIIKQSQNTNQEFEVLKQELATVQKKLDDIYSMRTWKLITKYRNFMDSSKCGRLMKKIARL